jgi:peptide/nickel transport system substrate-binding protein
MEFRKCGNSDLMLPALRVGCFWLMAALLTGCVAQQDQRDSATTADGGSGLSTQTASTAAAGGAIPVGEYVDDPRSGHSYNLDDYHALTGQPITRFGESPLLTPRVKAGDLPPVEERLPDNPIVVIPWETIGTYGGTLRYAATGFVGDTYLRYLNEAPLVETRPEPGTSNIVKYINATLDPGILEHWEQDEEARIFTFRIRRGLKWSDGAPVTTEDVRFCIEDIVFNEELYPLAQEWAQWGGARMKLEIVDRYTFRFEFADSYGIFLQRMAQWRWWWFMLPSHYLKPQHVKYTDVNALLPRMRESGYDSANDWGRWYSEIHARRWGVEEFVPGKVPDVEHYPTLDPWLHVSQPNPGDLLMERNPYYYKIDPAGNQLPYIDHLRRTYVADIQMKNMKIISGETDLQFQWMRLSDFPLLKLNEEAGDYHAVILRSDQEYRLIYPFNFSTKDPVWNEIIRDVRFRQALSLAFNRDEMNDVLWLGAGRPAQLAPARGSVWYEEAFEKAYAEYDLDRAHQLLDEMGLRWDDEHEFRLRVDGERLTLILHYPAEYTEWGNGAEMAGEYWSALGIDVIVKSSGLLDQLTSANGHQAIVWCGNGAVPTDRSFICGFSHTPLWHNWYNTGGEDGEVPLPWAREVYETCDALYSAPSEQRRTALGKHVFELLAEHLYVLSTVAEAPVPFIYSKRMRNISVAKQRGYFETTASNWAEQYFFGS